MRSVAIFALFFALTCFTQAHSVVIVVHGSFASTTSWPQPDGDFFTELENQAKELGHPVVSFCWSGLPTEQEIIKGGKMLAQLIMSYPDQEKIITVGHSHGGNLINVASQLLHVVNNREDQDFFTFIAPIVLEIPASVTKPEMELLATTKTFTVTQTIEQKSVLNFSQLFEQAANELLAWQKNRDTGLLTKKSPAQKLPRQSSRAIEMSYTLGTPVDMVTLSPQMAVIKRMVSLYSTGDGIQPVLGFFDRTYPMHERRTNISVRFCFSNNRQKEPSHSELHHNLIGRWLLCIPDVLGKLKLGNFEQFKFGIDGTIDFYEDREPCYSAPSAPCKA